MGGQTPHTLSPDVCQIWLDQCWLWYAQVFQLPGFPLCITSISFGLWEMWETNNETDNVVCDCEKKKKIYIYVYVHISFVILDESRIEEISKQLRTQHEKFCPWPDFPCPGRSKEMCSYIFTLFYIHDNHCEYAYYFREVLAHSFLWTISSSNSLHGTFQEHLSFGPAAASTKVRAAEVYGEVVGELLPFWILKMSHFKIKKHIYWMFFAFVKYFPTYLHPFFAVTYRRRRKHFSAANWWRTEKKGRDSMYWTFSCPSSCMHCCSFWLGCEVTITGF